MTTVAELRELAADLDRQQKEAEALAAEASEEKTLTRAGALLAGLKVRAAAVARQLAEAANHEAAAERQRQAEALAAAQEACRQQARELSAQWAALMGEFDAANAHLGGLWERFYAIDATARTIGKEAARLGMGPFGANVMDVGSLSPLLRTARDGGDMKCFLRYERKRP